MVRTILGGGGDHALISRDSSSLATGRVCDRVGRQNTAAVRSFWFRFAERKEQSAACMSGSLLERRVSRMERIREETSQAFQERAIGGCGAQLVVCYTRLGCLGGDRKTRSPRYHTVIEHSIVAGGSFPIFGYVRQNFPVLPQVRQHVSSEVFNKIKGVYYDRLSG